MSCSILEHRQRPICLKARNLHPGKGGTICRNSSHSKPSKQPISASPGSPFAHRVYRLERARLRAANIPEPAFDLYIKAESEQPIGSFKLRGAYNMVAQLSPEELKRGVITYSSGNHAQGVAYAARALGAKAVIVMPDNAPQVKLDATRALGAEIVLVGPASSERFEKARELVALHGYAMIPPYDAPQIIAGQAPAASRSSEQLRPMSISSSRPSAAEACSAAPPPRSSKPHPMVQVWGAEPELAADAKESFDTKTPRRVVRRPDHPAPSATASAPRASAY